MSDTEPYTPTTDKVREEYASQEAIGTDTEMLAEFDRWLAAHDAEVARAAAKKAWDEGAVETLTRVSNGYDSVIMDVNPYRLEQNDE